MFVLIYNITDKLKWEAQVMLLKRNSLSSKPSIFKNVAVVALLRYFSFQPALHC